jgi:hypothetical protein
MMSNEEMEILWKKKQDEYKAKYDKFLDVVIEEMFDLVGNSSDLSFECDERGINILVNRSSLLKFYLEDDCFLLSQLYNQKIVIKLSNLDTFRDVVRQLITTEVIPSLYNFYKMNYIKVLPTRLQKENKKLDFSKITVKWLTEKFEEISGNCCNGETIENVVILPLDLIGVNDGIEISFDVDCGRYGLHRDQSIKINDKGYVKINFFDSPIEGSGVESNLKDEISKLLGL